MSRSKVDPKKEEQERLASILESLLKEEENKYCADCNAKTPRWAAWNLGVFICITCAGIHRNLGVHISKVRSVNLDSWTPEQVQSMRVMGNEKAKKVYEHSLPANFRRSMSSHQLEQFIRAKYDQKKYMIRDFVYPRVDANDLPKSGAIGAKSTLVIRDANFQSINTPPVKQAQSAAAPNFLLDFSEPAKPVSANTNSLDLFANDPFGASAPAPVNSFDQAPSNDLDDMFGNFVSATPSGDNTHESTFEANFDAFKTTPDVCSAPTNPTSKTDPLSNELMGLSMNEPALTTLDEKKSNADILSLFSSSTTNATPQLVAPGGFAAFGIQAAPSATPAPVQNNSLNLFDSQPQASAQLGGTASLLGLNFSSAPNVPQQPMGASMMSSMPNMGSFPNPFGSQSSVPNNLFSGSIPSQPAQTASGFSTPSTNKAANSFADLSIGKVMGTLSNMGSTKPAPMTASVAKPTPVAAPVSSSSMNFDDLLGL